MPDYEIADRGARRPASVLKRARSFMSPEEAAADRKRRLEELEAPYAEDGEDGHGPEAA